MLVSCGRVWKYLCSRTYNLPNNWTLTVVHVTWKLITEDVASVWKLCLQYPHYVHNLFCSFLVYMHLTEYISHRIHIIIHISMVSCQKGPIRHAYAWQIEPFWQGPYPPCLRMADRALLAGYPRYVQREECDKISYHTEWTQQRVLIYCKQDGLWLAWCIATRGALSLRVISYQHSSLL